MAITDWLKLLLIYPLALAGMALLDVLVWRRMEGLGEIDD